MKRIVTSLVVAAAVLGFLAAPVMAQTAPPSSSSGMSGSPAAAPPSLPQEKQVEGPVKKVDPATKTVEVGRFFGLFSKKLEVTDTTNISIEGKKGSLEDLQQGSRVKASYEPEDGKNIATSIEVMPSKTKTSSAQASQ